MKLNELEIGKTAVVDAVGGEGRLRQHFLDMGIIPGVKVTLVQYAPMGDPMQLRLRGYELTLRLSDAESIEVTETVAGQSANVPGSAVIRNAACGDVTGSYEITYASGTPTADWWQVQMFDGHWGGMDLGLGNGNNVNPNIYDLSEGYIAIELDADRAEKFTTLTDWGQYAILQGENFIVTGISLIQFGETEKVLFEGPVSLTWGDDGRFGLAMSFFEKAAPDSKLIVYFHQTENWGQVQFNDGSWGNSGIVFPELGGPILNTDNVGGKDVEKIELTLTASILEVIRSNPGNYFGLNTEYQDDGRVGMIIQGSDWIIDKVTIQ